MFRWAVLLVGLSMTITSQAKVMAADDCTKEPEIVTQVRELAAVAEVQGGCAKPEKLKGICGAVYKEFEVKEEGSPFYFEYERQIHEAACADPTKDSEELVQKKIQSMWVKLQDHLTCDTANFDVQRGNILKYSVKLKNSMFLAQAVEIWKVNLNRVDPNDQKTVLDYVDAEIERTKGSSSEDILKGYREVLIKYGAKRKSEL